MKNVWEKYREIVMYTIFGVLTTVVGLGTYFGILALAEHVLHLSPEDPAVWWWVRLAAQVLHWIAAVTFAYVTNKRLVFRAEGGNELVRIGKFFATRLFSLGLDTAATFGTAFVLEASGYRAFTFLSVTFTADLWSKVVASIVVLIVNYVLSKFLVFTDKKKD